MKRAPSGSAGKGLRKLPTSVRNKMGYMKKGGTVTTKRKTAKGMNKGGMLKKAKGMRKGGVKMAKGMRKGGVVKKAKGTKRGGARSKR